MAEMFEGFKPVSIGDFEKLEKRRLSKHSLWAEDAIGAFLELTEEAVEITKWPEGKNASQISACIRDNANRLFRSKDIKVSCHDGRVFLIRREKACKIVEMPKPSKRRIPMPQSSTGPKKARGMM